MKNKEITIEEIESRIKKLEEEVENLKKLLASK